MIGGGCGQKWPRWGELRGSRIPRGSRAGGAPRRRSAPAPPARRSWEPSTALRTGSAWLGREKNPLGLPELSLEVLRKGFGGGLG